MTDGDTTEETTMGGRRQPNWEVVETEGHIYIQEGNRYIAEVLGGWGTARKDAARIAAAPKLAEALENLVNWIEAADADETAYIQEAMDKARAALSPAERGGTA